MLAIFVTDPKAPPVTVQATGLGARPRELRVGMTKKEVGDILKGQRSDLFRAPSRIRRCAISFTRSWAWPSATPASMFGN